MEIGPRLSAESLAITRFKDKERDMTVRFGEPTSRSFDAYGLVELTWVHYRDRPDRRGQPETKALHVALDEHGAVADYILKDTDPRFFIPR